MINLISVSLERRFLRDSVGLYVYSKTRGSDRVSIADPIVFREIDFSSYTIPDPALELSTDSAQALFDELYRLGFRPKEEGTAGQVSAMSAHLRDQRELSTRLLGMLERKIFEPQPLIFQSSSGSIE